MCERKHGPIRFLKLPLEPLTRAPAVIGFCETTSGRMAEGGRRCAFRIGGGSGGVNLNAAKAALLTAPVWRRCRCYCCCRHRSRRRVGGRGAQRKRGGFARTRAGGGQRGVLRAACVSPQKKRDSGARAAQQQRSSSAAAAQQREGGFAGTILVCDSAAAGLGVAGCTRRNSDAIGGLLRVYGTCWSRSRGGGGGGGGAGGLSRQLGFVAPLPPPPPPRSRTPPPCLSSLVDWKFTLGCVGRPTII